MKKTLAVLLTVLVVFAMAACRGGFVASPTPMITVKPTTSPMTGTTGAPMSPSPSAPMSPSTTGGDSIEGFVEGDTVAANALPSAITAAVTEKYPGATIKSASYATYMDAQMYLITLEGATDNTDKIYVKADGSIVPYAAPTGT